MDFTPPSDAEESDIESESEFVTDPMHADYFSTMICPRTYFHDQTLIDHFSDHNFIGAKPNDAKSSQLPNQVGYPVPQRKRDTIKDLQSHAQAHCWVALPAEQANAYGFRWQCAWCAQLSTFQTDLEARYKLWCIFEKIKYEKRAAAAEAERLKLEAPPTPPMPALEVEEVVEASSAPAAAVAASGLSPPTPQQQQGQQPAAGGLPPPPSAAASASAESTAVGGSQSTAEAKTSPPQATEKPHKKHTSRKPRPRKKKVYSLEYKVRVLAWFYTHDRNAKGTGDRFGVNRDTVTRWWGDPYLERLAHEYVASGRARDLRPPYPECGANGVAYGENIDCGEPMSAGLAGRNRQRNNQQQNANQGTASTASSTSSAAAAISRTGAPLGPTSAADAAQLAADAAAAAAAAASVGVAGALPNRRRSERMRQKALEKWKKKYRTDMDDEDDGSGEDQGTVWFISFGSAYFLLFFNFLVCFLLALLLVRVPATMSKCVCGGERREYFKRRRSKRSMDMDTAARMTVMVAEKTKCAYFHCVLRILLSGKVSHAATRVGEVEEIQDGC